MLWLLHDWFWMAGEAVQMQKVISSCKQCIQHEGSCAKAPMWPIFVTTPLEMLYVDFSSIETMIELDQPPNMANLLVFCDHIIKHVIPYVTHNQTAETVAKFLWQGYISIFRAQAKLLSYWGANFESNIFRDLCKLIGIWKVRTSPYHAQTNGQVEWAHQTSMCMIAKLSKDQEADWPKHLPKLVHYYNSTRLAITRYSPHYLMFGCWLCLPFDFYFAMKRGMKKHQCVDYYVAELHEWLKDTFKEVQVQSTSEVERQKWHYNRKANAILLEPGNLALAEANAYRGRRKVKDWWEEEVYEVECQVVEGIPSYLMKNQWTGCSWVLHWNWLFLLTPMEGTPLCTVVWAKQARCTTTTLEEQNPEGSETEEVP